jgi:hypothetical protein
MNVTNITINTPHYEAEIKSTNTLVRNVQGCIEEACIAHPKWTSMVVVILNDNVCERCGVLKTNGHMCSSCGENV